VIAVLALACGPKAPPAADPPEVPMGPIAGPRNVVEEAPPPPVPADTPGTGPLPTYLSRVRAAVNPEFFDCLATLGGVVTVEPALVVATIEGDGSLRKLEIRRSSGALEWDACLMKAFRAASLPEPPPEALVEGQLVTPSLAFR
jgi:hypothetical protein